MPLFVLGLRERVACVATVRPRARGLWERGLDAGHSPAATGGPRSVEIKLTDAGCDPASVKLDAGRTTFKVTNARTSRVSELEVRLTARASSASGRIWWRDCRAPSRWTCSPAMDPVLPGWDDRGDGHRHGRRH